MGHFSKAFTKGNAINFTGKISQLFSQSFTMDIAAGNP